MILYVLHDKVAGTYSFPATTNNSGTALREFAHMSRRPDFPASDLEILLVGHFDPKTGIVTSVTPTLITAQNEV